MLYTLFFQMYFFLRSFFCWSFMNCIILNMRFTFIHVIQKSVFVFHKTEEDVMSQNAFEKKSIRKTIWKKRNFKNNIWKCKI